MNSDAPNSWWNKFIEERILTKHNQIHTQNISYLPGDGFGDALDLLMSWGIEGSCGEYKVDGVEETG